MIEYLNGIQLKLLEMFKWYHEFCVDNNLKYYALGGTMLGAIRHKGFIPWDDDIDVGMPRDDYNKFIELTCNKKFGKYIVESIYDNNPDYYYGYSKLYDTSTTLIEKTRINIKRGIYIDLFPLDGICNDEKAINKTYLPIYNRYQLIVARSCAILARRSKLKNLVIVIARLIPTWIINDKKLIINIDKMCSKHSFDKCNYVGNLLGNWGKKEIMPREVFGNPILYKFENIEIFGVEEPDEYLKLLYNDWKKLPPVEKQVSLHDAIDMDLNKSYLE